MSAAARDLSKRKEGDVTGLLGLCLARSSVLSKVLVAGSSWGLVGLLRGASGMIFTEWTFC